MPATACRKVCFFKKVLVLNPYPQTPSPWEGVILLGLPPLDPVGGYAPATPFLSTIEVFRQSEAMPAGLSKNLYDFLNGILG